MKLARYLGGGEVAIVEEPAPECPVGGLLVQTVASGLCSGELMIWYMDRKVPHVIGHEVSGVVIESQDARFPVGSKVAPHHHAPCLNCDLCLRGAYVHCPTWKKTKLIPGGMAAQFAVSAENLNDCHRVDDLDPRDAALTEPLACVMKQLRRLQVQEGEKCAVIGLGFMGLLHALCLPGCVAYDLNPARIEWARSQGIDARLPEKSEPAEVIVMCPGTEAAFQFALDLALPDARIGIFSPLPPGELPFDFEKAYMRDLTLVNSYSCGPDDTAEAVELLRLGSVKADQVVSDFISLDELPEFYTRMKNGEILKPMVMFS